MNARAKVCLHRQLKFVIATAKVWEHQQPKFVNATAKVWHAAREAEKFHMFSLPHCRCYPEGLYLNSQQRFWLQFYWFIMPPALPGCRFHVVVSTFVAKNQATKHWPTHSLNQCTESVLILGQVKKIRCFSSPPTSFFAAASFFLLFTIFHTNLYILLVVVQKMYIQLSNSFGHRSAERIFPY